MFDPSPSPVLALATTVHLSLALLRNHRRHAGATLSPIALLSFSFAALPWVLPTLLGLLAGFAAHLVWFGACERLLAPGLAPAVMSATARRSPAVDAPATHTLPTSARAASSAIAAPTRPGGFVQTPVIAVIDETPDIKTFRLSRPEGFQFDAGQFLALRLRVDGQEFVRCYSISSAPDASGYLEISVKRQGVVSNALHAMARPGALLSVKAPAGAFCYPAADDRPLLLLAGGVGITPLISMLRHAIASEPTRPVTLIYSVHTESGFGFLDDLRAIAPRNPQVRMFFTATDATRPNVYRGRIDERLLRTVVPDLVHSIAFICGPPPMIDAMRTLLARLGVPKPQIRFEVFEAAIAAAGRANDDAPAALARPLARTPGARQASYDMHCAKSGARVAVKPGQTILDAAESAGVEVHSLCRAGVCGTCRVKVTAGNAHCESTTLADSDRAAGFVLACVSTLASDCTVQL